MEMYNIGDQKEMEEEYKSMSDKYDFYILPNIYELGVVDGNKSLQNISLIVEKAKEALIKESFLEFVSLKLQYLDFFLRMYYVRKNSRGKIFSASDKRTFGDIINSCKQLGFDQSLIIKLEEFNNLRVNAIHKFMLGEIEYEDIRLAANRYSKLGNEISDYVIKEIGVKIFSPSSLPDPDGSMLFSVKK